MLFRLRDAGRKWAAWEVVSARNPVGAKGPASRPPFGAKGKTYLQTPAAAWDSARTPFRYDVRDCSAAWLLPGGYVFLPALTGLKRVLQLTWWDEALSSISAFVHFDAWREHSLIEGIACRPHSGSPSALLCRVSTESLHDGGPEYGLGSCGWGPILGRQLKKAFWPPRGRPESRPSIRQIISCVGGHEFMPCRLRCSSYLISKGRSRSSWL